MANKAKKQRPATLSVYLYIPNIVGYMRVLWNCIAFAVCFSNKTLFPLLSFFSFCCDAVDGWCARKFNQVSTFGAVLDMLTDRVSTACLLVILSQIYRPSLVFLSLLALDIASHWLQMYSHKDVKDSTSWLFRLYYGNRMFMLCFLRGFSAEQQCMSAEVIKKAFQATEEGFLSIVSSQFQTRPQIATVGSCCLVCVICDGTLYVANAGDSRTVLGQVVRATGKTHATQLSTEHNASIESVRRELQALHPDHPDIVVLKHNVW